MDENMFETIADELGELNFSGIIYLQQYNEPLADPRIVQKVGSLKKKVPRAVIDINSNGDFLTIKLLKDLVSAGLNRLLVTQYRTEMHSNIKKIIEEANEKEKKVLVVRCKTDFIGNRAGNLDKYTVPETLNAGCYLPSDQLVINYKGEVLICCNDYYGKVILSKVGRASLVDIWSNQKFRNIRKVLKKKQRFKIETCKGCNFLGDIQYRDLTPEEVIKYNRGLTDWRREDLDRHEEDWIN
jgi:radical SAM protein with 4Fe4S-binding SPASM domain